MILAGFAVAFYDSWEMTDFLAGIPPLGIAENHVQTASQDAYMGKEAYQKAGSIASWSWVRTYDRFTIQ